VGSFLRRIEIGVWLGVSILSAGLLAASAAVAQELEVSLRFDKGEYLIGEPVVGYVEIQNSGESIEPVHSRLDADLMYVTYTIRDPDGAERRFVPYGIADAAHPLAELEPGASVYGYVLLFHGAQGWTFTAPGRYEVTATYLGRYLSDPVAIEIRGPQSETEAEQVRMVLEEPEVGRFFMFEEGDHLTEGLSVISELAEDPDTVLGRYAAYMLASSLSKSFPDYEEGRVREANPERANELFQEIRTQLPSFYFTEKTYMLQAMNYRRMGDDQRAATVEAEWSNAMARRFDRLEPWQEVIAAQVESRYLD
jgi:hypothetical protein